MSFNRAGGGPPPRELHAWIRARARARARARVGVTSSHGSSMPSSGSRSSYHTAFGSYLAKKT